MPSSNSIVSGISTTLGVPAVANTVVGRYSVDRLPAVLSLPSAVDIYDVPIVSAAVLLQVF
jgi:hypothetical protein